MDVAQVRGMCQIISALRFKFSVFRIRIFFHGDPDSDRSKNCHADPVPVPVPDKKHCKFVNYNGPYNLMINLAEDLLS